MLLLSRKKNALQVSPSPSIYRTAQKPNLLDAMQNDSDNIKILNNVTLSIHNEIIGQPE